MEKFFLTGDYVHILDEDLQVNKYSRVLEMERNILKPFQYNLVVGDALEKNRVIEVVKDVKRIDIKIK